MKGEHGRGFAVVAQEVGNLASMSDKILSASREQTLGLKQINEAITQLDKNTQESVITAEEMADSGHKLDKSSSTLRAEVEKLLQIVRGQ